MIVIQTNNIELFLILTLNLLPCLKPNVICHFPILWSHYNLKMHHHQNLRLSLLNNHFPSSKPSSSKPSSTACARTTGTPARLSPLSYVTHLHASPPSSFIFVWTTALDRLCKEKRLHDKPQKPNNKITITYKIKKRTKHTQRHKHCKKKYIYNVF